MKGVLADYKMSLALEEAVRDMETAEKNAIIKRMVEGYKIPLDQQEQDIGNEVNIQSGLLHVIKYLNVIISIISIISIIIFMYYCIF